MNRKILIAVGIVAVAAVLGLLAFNNKGNNSSAPASGVGSGEKSESLTKGSIKGLLNAGKSVMCEINYTDTQGKGTVYVDGKKFRGDFDAAVGGQPRMLTHMVSDGEMTYIWTEGSNQGTKMKTDEPDQETQTPPASAAGSNEVADWDKDVDMKCSGWTADGSKFAVPANVTFSDLSSMMEKLAPSTKENGSSAPNPSSCESITDPETKAACIAATGQ